MIVSKKFVLLGALIGALVSAHSASAQSTMGATMRDANSAYAARPHNPPDLRVAPHNPPDLRTGPSANRYPPDPYAVPPDPYKCLMADAFAKLMGQKSSCQ